jgi:hypothetical protein
MFGSDDRAMLTACWTIQTMILDRLVQSNGPQIIKDIRNNALALAPKNRKAATLLLYVADELTNRHQPKTRFTVIEGGRVAPRG